jgi:hypothetical protein
MLLIEQDFTMKPKKAALAERKGITQVFCPQKVLSQKQKSRSRIWAKPCLCYKAWHPKSGLMSSLT